MWDSFDKLSELIYAAQCGHEFHSSCLQRYYRKIKHRKPRCPLCRRVDNNSSLLQKRPRSLRLSSERNDSDSTSSLDFDSSSGLTSDIDSDGSYDSSMISDSSDSSDSGESSASGDSGDSSDSRDPTFTIDLLNALRSSLKVHQSSVSNAVSSASR